jgi:sigma-E factor negative regulatory protein RseA
VVAGGPIEAVGWLESKMAQESVDQEYQKRLLSELADGEVDAEGLRRACAAWREDPALRDDWHSYHLIGDVLRSDDLAAAPRHDEAFLATLRSRLEAEPVVLAPQPLVATRRAAAPSRRWFAPVAVAAGFMAVAGVLVVTRLAAPVQEPSATALAAAEPAPAVSTLAEGAEPGLPQGRDLQLIRDARLDRYLAAHRQFGGDTLAVPGVSLRHAAIIVPDR